MSNALERESLSNLFRKFEISLTKKGEVYRRGYSPISVDRIETAGDLTPLFKREEIIGFVLSKEYKNIESNFKLILKDMLPKKEESKLSILEDVSIYINLDSSGKADEFLIVDKEENLISGNVAAILKHDLITNKEGLTNIIAKAPAMRVVFEPNKPSGVLSEQNKKMLKSHYLFNLYQKQEWEKLTPSETPPEAFIRLCEHVFPDYTQRSNVFSWVIHALDKRSELALVLLGRQGVGKSTFVNLLFHLAGFDVCTEISDRFFDSNFNEEIKNKKFVCFEEVMCRGDGHKSKLKRNMNEYIMIEGKNKQVQMVSNYASFIFTCNHPRLLEVEPRDRRFYIPDLGPNKASDEIIGEIKRKRNDDQFLCDIVNYMKENSNSEFDHFKPDKNTKSFWAMVKHGAPAPLRHVFRTLEKHEGEWVTYQQLADSWETKRAANVLFPDFDELCDFLSEYKPMGVSVIEIDYELNSLKYSSFGETKDQEDAGEWILS
jgi:hypothetical protein